MLDPRFGWTRGFDPHSPYAPPRAWRIRFKATAVELGNHGWLEHTAYLYDEQVRVPLLVGWPGHLSAGMLATFQEERA